MRNILLGRQKRGWAAMQWAVTGAVVTDLFYHLTVGQEVMISATVTGGSSKAVNVRQIFPGCSLSHTWPGPENKSRIGQAPVQPEAPLEWEPFDQEDRERFPQRHPRCDRKPLGEYISYH